jgi:hypothetical protein
MHPQYNNNIKIKIKEENYRPIFLMIIDSKTFLNVQANQIQQHVKVFFHGDQVGLILGI